MQHIGYDLLVARSLWRVASLCHRWPVVPLCVWINYCINLDLLFVLGFGLDVDRIHDLHQLVPGSCPPCKLKVAVIRQTWTARDKDTLKCQLEHHCLLSMREIQKTWVWKALLIPLRFAGIDLYFTAFIWLVAHSYSLLNFKACILALHVDETISRVVIVFPTVVTLSKIMGLMFLHRSIGK